MSNSRNKGFSVLLGSQQVIPTPGINQSDRGGSGHSSSLVGLSLWLVATRYDLSVWPLQLFLILHPVKEVKPTHIFIVPLS